MFTTPPPICSRPSVQPRLVSRLSRFVTASLTRLLSSPRRGWKPAAVPKAQRVMFSSPSQEETSQFVLLLVGIVMFKAGLFFY